jgi:nitrite reductase/ring-hydroxylating ferredoxin subunit
MSQWIAVCRLDEITEGRAVAREAAGLRLAIVKHEGQIVALSGRCPHANGPLGHGWVEDHELVCPLHRWRFKLSDGRCTTMRGHTIHRFRTEIRGDDVWVEV